MSERDYLLPDESKQLGVAGLTTTTSEALQTILDTWKNL